MNYHDIVKHDMLNGSGLRTTLFVSGCHHHCEKCHNPQTWDFDSGILFDDSAMKEILDNLSYDYCKGLTISGGDPLARENIDVVAGIIQRVKRIFLNTKDIWVYTGYTYEELHDRGLDQTEWFNAIDVLVDGRFEYKTADVNLPYRGSHNQRLWNIRTKTIIDL